MFKCRACGSKNVSFLTNNVDVFVQPNVVRSQKVLELLQSIGKKEVRFSGFSSFAVVTNGEIEITGGVCANCGHRGSLDTHFIEQDLCVCGRAAQPVLCKKFGTIVCNYCVDTHYCVGCKEECVLAKPGEEAPFAKPVDFQNFINNFGRQ